MSVEVGQIYRDRDQRMSGGHRHVRVERIDGDFALCRATTADGSWQSMIAPTRIRFSNLRKRFVLVDACTAVKP